MLTMENYSEMLMKIKINEMLTQIKFKYIAT